jgi:hypothetical protein
MKKNKFHQERIQELEKDIETALINYDTTTVVNKIKVTPIYKSGNSSDPSNYRGICVSSCMGKLLCSILNTRLMNFARENNLIHVLK